MKISKEENKKLKWIVNDTVISMHQMEILTSFDSDKRHLVNVILETYKENLLNTIEKHTVQGQVVTMAYIEIDLEKMPKEKQSKLWEFLGDNNYGSYTELKSGHVESRKPLP